MEMTMIEALEYIAELNDCAKILVQTSGGEPQLIENAIYDERQQRGESIADDILDLRVTKDSIRKYDEDGYFDNNEPLYKVLRDIAMFDELSKELKDFIGETSFFTIRRKEALML